MKIKNTRSIKLIALVLAIILALPAVTYAAVLFTSYIRANLGIGTGDYDGTDDLPFVSVETSAQSLSFAAPGASNEFGVTVKNGTDADISYYHELSLGTLDRGAAAAVLVYYDGKFLGTLGSLCQNGVYRIESDGFVMAKNEEGERHTFTFEMHIGAPASYTGTAIPVTVKTYTKNIDYQKYIFASSDAEFERAVSDINSGMLNSAPVIVLSGSFSLTKEYTLSLPAELNLNGYTLDFAEGASLSLTGSGAYKITSSRALGAASLGAEAGSIVLDNSAAYLDIEEFEGAALYGRITRAENFDAASASALVKERFVKNIGKGIQSGASGALSYDVLSSLDFYGLVDTSVADGYTYSGGVITPSETLVSLTEEFKIGNESIFFRILGCDDLSVYLGLFNAQGGELAYLAALDAGVNFVPVIDDLFLPTAIPGKGVTIKYTTSDAGIMDANGRIADTVSDSAEVTITAEITINESVYRYSFVFKVSSMTNETRFSNFAASINASLHNVYKESEHGDKEKFYLPLLTGQYAYTQPYTAITYDTKDASGNVITESRDWDGYSDIGLEMIKYTSSSTYGYVTLENGNTLYLNAPTFYNFALISISGKFAEDDEIYTETLSITIDLGQNNDELYGIIFGEVASQMSDVDILQNILDTRVKYGMANESGDFWLPDNYMYFDIEYSIKTKSNILRYTNAEGNGFLHDQENKRYHIGINAEALTPQDTYVLLNVTVSPDGNDSTFSQERELTFKVPGAILPDSSGFQNIGAFSSVKYQVYNALPREEREQTSIAEGSALDLRLKKLPSYGTVQTYDSGFSVSGDILTNSTGGYILTRDAEKCTELAFIIGNTSNSAEYKVYTMSRLISWAIGNTETASPLGTAGVMSDGHSYLTPTEVEEIKKYYKAETRSTDAEWNALWSKVSTEAPGYIVYNGKGIDEFLKKYVDPDTAAANGISLRLTEYYFKHLEIMQWATDQVDWDTNEVYACPNMTYVGDYDWDMGGTGSPNTATGFDINASWTAAVPVPEDLITNSKYNTTPDFFSDDDTDYISVGELQMLIAFHLNYNVNRGFDTLEAHSTGKAFARKFLECALIPINLNDGAVEMILSEMYNKLGTSPDGFTASIDADYGVPYVSNMDGTEVGISYFKNLVKLHIVGDVSTTTYTYETTVRYGQSAFIQSTSLSAFFNRVTSLCSDTLIDLRMRNAAGPNTAFDISNAERFTALQVFDISYNRGISSVGALVDLPMSNIEYLDICGVGVQERFLIFPLDNIYAKAPNATLRYTKDMSRIAIEDTPLVDMWADGFIGPIEIFENQYERSREAYYKGTGDIVDALAYLEEIGSLRANYLQLCETVADSSLPGESASVIWRIEEGNSMSYIADPGLSSMSLDEIKRLGTNFYYCTANVSYTNVDGNNISLTANTLYSVDYSPETGLSFKTVRSNVPKTNTPPKPAAAPSSSNGSFSEAYVVNASTKNIAETYTETSTSGTLITFNESDHLRAVYGYNDPNGNATKLAQTPNWGGAAVPAYLRAVMYNARTVRNYTYTYTASGIYQTTQTLSTPENTYMVNSSGELVQYTYKTYVTNASGASYRHVVTNITETTYSGLYLTNYYNDTTASFEVSGYTYIGFFSNRIQVSPTSSKDVSDLSNRMQITFARTPAQAFDTVQAANPSGWSRTADASPTGWLAAPTKTTLITGIRDLSSASDAASVDATATRIKNGDVYTKYNGAATSQTFYNTATGTYTLALNNANVYMLTYTENGFKWEVYQDGVASDTINMEAILQNAQSEYTSDPTSQIKYYGNYYFYNGPTIKLSNGHTYTKGTVYRLMMHNNMYRYNATDLVCTVDYDNNTFISRFKDLTEDDVGKIFYLKAAGMTYNADQFYEVTLNEETGSYFLKIYSTLSYSPNSQGRDRLVNERVFDRDRHGRYYGGTGGTHTAVISATVIINGREYKRLFEVPVIG